ncbi:MAG: hypothetical protein KJO98_04805, partial [Rhodothermia bacterium]|nr:hypothetical protein [Rhodothermia bacterium]
LVFYTDRARYEVLVTKYVRRGSHPLKPEIQFWTEDVHTVRSIAIDERIDLVEFYENGIQRGGTRNLLFRSVSLDPEEPSVLYANWI